ALFEKVVKKEVLKKNMVNIRVGEPLDVDFIIEVFVEYGFERTDFVYEPGQFAIRGDIVDIFSFAHDLPYRIELFDNEVESIRLFEPSSQLSQKKIERINFSTKCANAFYRRRKNRFF
ncbi:MAG: transcription-repair coupling factor, partial [Leadbetterella sp.]|nr:transcription-repair coupling factor [Leadbetterella sp.]